uniref:Uncharacterized protein LOC114348484 n=1 Tax=Diabrotica virgifera virgifera TaxID=50390 RepID=A0A6P7H8D8_DIAVI
MVLTYIRGMVIPSVKKRKQTNVASEDKRSTKEVRIITNLINKLMLSGAISIVDHSDDQYISKVFAIPKSDGSYRLILNLNKFRFVENPHFKIEGNKVVVRLIFQGCFMSKIDLRYAYHLINQTKTNITSTNVCTYLGFTLDSNNLTVTLPNSKKLKILKMLQYFLRLPECKIRKFAKNFGTLVSACPAIKFAFLHIKLFERHKYLALI